MSTATPLVLVVHGEETFLVEEEAKAFQRHWRRDLVSDFGFETVEASGLTAARLADALLQAPFLDPHRLVMVRWVQPSRADQLAPALAQVPETTRLLVTVNGRLPAGSKLVKAANALPGGSARDFPRLKGRKLSDWASSRARGYGLAPNYAALVVRLSPPDLAVIDSELRKLADYIAAGHPLNQAIVMQLLAGGREEDVFRLTDQLLPRPTAGAWRTARKLVDSGFSPTTLAYRIARQLALVLEVKTRQERGEDLAQVQAAMREHPFVVQKAFELAPSTGSERLESGLHALLTYEWEVKSGQVDADLGFEVLLAKL